MAAGSHGAGACCAEMSSVSSSSAAAAMLATGAVRWEPAVQAQCLAEFAPCSQQNCCAPHRCFRQSQFFAQCGRACPRDPSWECHAERMRRVGVILSRWGSWHGIAINNNPNLAAFQAIVPCGVSDGGVTSLAALGVSASMDELDTMLRMHFNRHFPARPQDPIQLDISKSSR